VHDDGLHPQSDAFRVACRLFPGFSELPASFRVSLEGYAPLFRPETGPLSQRERELIARAVSGRDADAFGAPHADDGAGASPPDASGSADERERRIAEFAVKVTRRWLAIDGADVERLLDLGLTAHAIRAIAEVAAVFHFLAEVSAAMLLRPRLARAGRAPMTVVGGRDPSWRELGRWLA
jgi:alkylhydroperoxidase family enzyme